MTRLLTVSSLTLNALLLLSVACGSVTLPRWDGEFWAADHVTQSVQIKAKDKPLRQILASDPKFSNGAWVSYQDLNCLYQQLIFNCAEFKDPAPKCKPMPDGKIKQSYDNYVR